jgi:hypothetical protein
MAASQTTVVYTPEVDGEEARAAWAVAARELLVDAAGSYRTIVTYQELASEVQARSGIQTSQRMQHWVGNVLLRVAQDCASRDEPNLASLCVNASGSVGEGYADAVLATTGERPEDADRHAAESRHECHQHFGATDIPDDGGRPALTPKLEASRARARKVAREARPVESCPKCFMAIPASGTCVNCE